MKAFQNKVRVAVGRVDLGVCTQLVSLVACRRFLMPTSFPYSDVLRDITALQLKFAQVGSLQRKTVDSRISKSAKSEPSPEQHQQQHYLATVGEDESGDAVPSTPKHDVKGAAAAPATGEAERAVEADARGLSTTTTRHEGDARFSPTVKEVEMFLPVPTTGPWAKCGAT